MIPLLLIWYVKLMNLIKVEGEGKKREKQNIGKKIEKQNTEKSHVGKENIGKNHVEKVDIIENNKIYNIYYIF